MVTKKKASPPTSNGTDKAAMWIGFGVVVLAIVLVLGSGIRTMMKGKEGVQVPDAPIQPQAQDPAQPQPKAEVPTQPKTTAQEQADLAPDFSLPQVGSGKAFHLNAQRGKVVLVDFWATWCGPCRMAIPHLIELQKEYGKKGFTMVGVSLDQQGEPVVGPFYQQWKMNYPVVIDSDGSVARNYGGIRSIPTAVLIDRKGKIINGFVGYRPKEVFEEAIKAALAKS